MKISIIFKFNSTILFTYSISFQIRLPHLASKGVGKTVKSVSSEFVRKKAFEIYNQNPRLHLVV
jgi:hypothetical protein